jgi:glycosyltransferase involved in cell wall biosynthesis
MKILVFPRDPNPYQRLLYDEMGLAGGQARYLGALTPSHTLNVLLLPLELAFHRARGTQFVHLHWVFGFSFPGGRRLRASRSVSQAWFALFLLTVRILRLRLAWTAHNVLPHAPVFADDAAARRALVRHSDVVFAHSTAALDGLAALGARPRRSLVIRHGPIGPAMASRLRSPGHGDGPREFLFFGKVAHYKGVEDLIAALGSMSPAKRDSARLTIAGQCDDPGLRARLRATSGIRLRLEHIPEAEVAGLLAAADIVVLPFRQVTTSGSAELALSHGRPLIVPDLPGLAGLPSGAVARYDGTTKGLADALARLADADEQTLAMMSAAALAYSAQASWRQIALATLAEMEAVLRPADDLAEPAPAASS